MVAIPVWSSEESVCWEYSAVVTIKCYSQGSEYMVDTEEGPGVSPRVFQSWRLGEEEG